MTLTEKLNNILPLVKKPARYIGGELHAYRKDWDCADVRFALIFPDLYEIGMSHFGLQILYHILNNRKDTLADRCFCPDVDMEKEMRQQQLPLFALESKRPLAEFDVIGITLPYELCYTNILTILDRAGLPFRSQDRSADYPLIIGGGSCGMNPEPVADFFDAIVLGDGEEVIEEIAELVCVAKKQGVEKSKLLQNLAQIEGVYVPSFFELLYTADGELVAVKPLMQDYEVVQRRVLPTLPRPEKGKKPLVPIVRPIHDRLGIEIARGCTRGCRFCQAGILYRPVRERSMDEIMEIAEQDIKSTGFEELALLSLSTGDYSCLPELMVRLMDRFADQYVSVSMPSMRVGTLTQEIMDQIKRVRKTGFTVAPEAGTDRLREVINKGISEADLLSTCSNAFGMGWNLIKLYFMIGLPTETWDDVESIVDLARKAKGQAGPTAKRVQINVSVGTFVPKPHTPFQWERQLTLDESRERIDRLKKLLPRKGFKLKWHDPRQSYLEGVFSRGDRRLAALIETAWKAGVRLDGWSEHYRLENWQEAAQKCGLDLDQYLLARDPDKPLPWDHLSSGVDSDFLKQELHNALERIYTKDCRNQGCQKCGLCDFKTILPVVHQKNEQMNAQGSRLPDHERPVRDNEKVFSYRIHYTRLENSRFYSHLEILQLIFRVLTRAGVPVLYSQGYNPSPRVSFSPALPVGMESEIEFFDIDLAQPLAQPETIVEKLNNEMPIGMQVNSVEIKPAKEPEALLVNYTISLVQELKDEQRKKIDQFLGQESHVIERVRKRKTRQIDIRPMVFSLEPFGDTITLGLISIQGKAGVSPRDILKEVIGLPEREILQAQMRKNTASVFSAIT